MFYFDGTRWQPFENKITYTHTIKEYDNDTTRFEGKDNLTIEKVTLTDEQLARLEVIRHNDIDLSDVIEYVMNGVIESEKIERADKANRSRMAILAQIDPTTIEPELLKESGLSRKWEPGSFMSAGELVEHNEALYKVLQSHQSQEDWTPDVSPSLFAPLLTSPTGEVLEWVQPDSTNPYMKGDKVTHNGKTWESMVDVNTWEPGAPGVDERIWREVP